MVQLPGPIQLPQTMSGARKPNTNPNGMDIPGLHQSSLRLIVTGNCSPSKFTLVEPQIPQDAGRRQTKVRYTHGNLILDTADVEEGLDLLPQLVPGPGTELQVLAQVALDNLEGDALFLELLEAPAGQITTGPGLHPGHDLAQTLITELLHLTQDTGAEEHLFVV